jgi:hypothetical protein
MIENTDIDENAKEETTYILMEDIFVGNHLIMKGTRFTVHVEEDTD